ncbi:hypothetical protein GOB57_24165 [Sinorhizobium meliloti]|nr:hypothetical protein [Sinorhizobium meliloti]
MDNERNLKNLSVGGAIWRAAMDRPFVVRATVGRVGNERVGSYDHWDEAREAADGYDDARIFHAVSGEDVTEGFPASAPPPSPKLF